MQKTPVKHPFYVYDYIYVCIPYSVGIRNYRNICRKAVYIRKNYLKHQ